MYSNHVPLAVTFVQALIGRCVAGALNGNIVALKTFLGAITDESNRSRYGYGVNATVMCMNVYMVRMSVYWWCVGMLFRCKHTAHDVLVCTCSEDLPSFPWGGELAQ